jgi:phosphate transport system substrate-binding protein
MKRTIAAFALLAAVACTGNAAPATGELRINGSNVFGETLGPRLVRSFTQANRDLVVSLRRPGTAEGLQALVEGKADIAPTSRLPDRREQRAARAAARTEIVAHPAAIYAVRIIVHESNPVKSLTAAQVRDLFSGRITNWKQVGGHDMPVQVFVLGTNTGARAGFQEVAMNGRNYARTALALPDYGEIAHRVSTQASGLGYTALGPLPERVVAVPVNGIAPTPATIREGNYPFARPLWLCTLRGRESANARLFLDFVSSSAARRIITRAGYVTVEK